MKSIETILKSIKDSGFSHLKVELEANLRRSGARTQEIRRPCADCAGGWVECAVCSHKGYVPVLNESGREEVDFYGKSFVRECPECAGIGKNRHSTCGGLGYIVEVLGGDFGSESFCKSWILEHVSKEAKAAINYAKFYYDGSVDSEITFTLPVEHGRYIIEFIRAFEQMSREINRGLDVVGAGMHIAVLQQGCGGRYPVSGIYLEDDKINNYMTQVSKLLPALFVAASGGEQSRPLRYRYPKISSNKYSAIHVMSGCIEYRLFETCYDRPEAVFEFLGVIARTLEFYKDPSKRIVPMGVKYPFLDKRGTSNLVRTADQIRIVKRQIKHILPDGMTLKEFQEPRKIKINIAEANRKEEAEVGEIRKLFQEHIRAYKTAVERPLSTSEENRLKELRKENRVNNLGIADETLKASVIGLSTAKLDEKEFIKKNIKNKLRTEIVLEV